MKVFVVGGTGFTGSYVVPCLLKAGHDVTCLVRSTSDQSHLPKRGMRLVDGSLEDGSALTRALGGHDALVCVASLGFGHAPTIVAAAERARVTRAVFISTTAVFTHLNARSKAVRLAAESTIMLSNVPYTILRPTMIYGSERDRNMIRMIRHLRRWPIIPVAGSGERLQQPIHVEDVASAVVDSLGARSAIREAFNIAGARPLTLNQMIDTITALLGRRVRKVHLPLAAIAAALGACERAGLQLPIRSEQILRLAEDKCFSWEQASRAFGFNPMSFEQGIAREIAALDDRAPRQLDQTT